MEIINCTRHDIIVVDKNGDKIVYKPSGYVARVMYEQEIVTEVNDIDVVRNIKGVQKGIPDPEPGKLYIVSAMFACSVNRSDILVPNTSPQGVIRDEFGNVVAIKSFITYPKSERVIN